MYAAFDISTFEVVTYWSRDYVTISFMWIFELTYDICITFCRAFQLKSTAGRTSVSHVLNSKNCKTGYPRFSS